MYYNMYIQNSVTNVYVKKDELISYFIVNIPFYTVLLVGHFR